MELIYEGKAKRIYKSENKDEVIIHYKDDTTAFNGLKKEKILNKGILNNEISAYIYTKLNEENIPTHFIKKLDDRNQLCKKVKIIPLEVIVRNIIAGSLAKRFNIVEGTVVKYPIKELCYKDDSLNDPLITDSQCIALGFVNEDDLKTIYAITDKINVILKSMFLEIGIRLVDFKIEFGKDEQGNIVLADEISPDTCRFWDLATDEKLDKDRFRRDMGGVINGYEEIFRRLNDRG